MERSKGLTTAANQESGVLALYIKLYGMLLAWFLGSHGGLGGDLHSSEDVVHGEFGYSRQIGRRCSQGYTNSGRLSSEAQDTSLTGANYVYFYLISLCA